jgi:hypothetical protein
MREINELLLQPAINVGLSELDFWNMTKAEVERYLEGAVWRHKTQAQFDYTLASLIGNAIGCCIGGGEFATLSDAYPSLFPKDEEETPEEIAKKEEIDTTNSVNRFLEFARKHNSKITKGVE